MRALLFLLLLAGCAASAQAPGITAVDPAPRCRIGDWDEAVVRAHGGVEIDGPAAFTRAYNAHPPVSRERADRVFALPTARSIVLLFVVGPCVTGVGEVTPATFERLMGEGV